MVDISISTKSESEGCRFGSSVCYRTAVVSNPKREKERENRRE
jgi:hypothetical protein